MNEFVDFNHQEPLELDILSKLYKQFSLFHESVEDFIERMEFDNGLDWLTKFTS